MAATEYDFMLTRTKIIKSALRKIGAIDSDSELRAEDEAIAVEALNNLVKSWQSVHTYLWTQEVVSISSGTNATYQFTGNDPLILWFDKVFIRVGNNSDIELPITTFYEYQQIVDKTSVGQPSQVAFDNKFSEPTMYMWPVPGQDYTMRVLYTRALKDMESASGVPEIPARALNALIYGLADLLADDYGTPLQERAYIASKYAAFFKEFRGSEKERPTFSHVESAYRVRNR